MRSRPLLLIALLVAARAADLAAVAAARSVPEPPLAARRAGNGDPAYGDVLALSLMFYEAQRAGRLPPTNRIAWRGDSGLQDRAPDGRDVSGGYYDAGDNVKFNLPMAWTVGTLAWSVVEFKKGYVEARSYDAALDAIRWGADYLMACVGDGGSIVAQVGDGASDHPQWRRPEDITTPNVVTTIDDARPGSDLAGAMAAALAAASVVFKDAGDPKYSDALLASARKAYAHAMAHKGVWYNAAVPDGARFYPSSNALDDVAWATVWLSIRTNDASLRPLAKELYYAHWKTEEGPKVWNNFDWDSNSWGDVVFLSRWFPEDPFFKTRMDGFLKDWLDAAGPWISKTPKGLRFTPKGTWGNLRHVGNALFLMKAYVNGLNPPNPALEKRVDCLAHEQLNYILGGATGRSYVCGYGPDPPLRPHHRAASCPQLSEPCTWDAMNSPDPNPHTLYGALVGGPDGADNYADSRGNYEQSEVAIDYNAGFTGALAAMMEPSVSAAQCGLKRRRL